MKPRARDRADADGDTGGPETLPTARDAGGSQTAHALHVTGPGGGERYLLSGGIVSLGRDPASGIVVDDPRTSRAHALLQAGHTITLTDLDSANGTFLDGRRLPPHQPTPVAVGQSFFMGDSTLVVRSTALALDRPGRVSTWAEVNTHCAAIASARGPAARTVLVRARPFRAADADGAAVILGQLLASPSDWLIRSASEVVLGLHPEVAFDEGRTRRDVLQRLASWSIGAEVDARVVPTAEIASRGGDPRPLLAIEPPVKLERGLVVFREPSMVALKRTLERVAPATVNVLVLGETGAGKDVVAALLHELSPRATKRFVGLNCASFPEALLESELFGHERGAFTGATAAKPGLLETADGGTVFLDEIGDLPMSLQAKLLRAIESHEVTRVGALVPRRIDVRFVAATNHDLEADVSAGNFRRDLFFRLNTVTVTVPPLRERRSEIEPLARLFLTSASARFNLPVLDLSPETIAALEAYPWPGNVRELRNLIERTALLATGGVIQAAQLDLRVRGPSRPRLAIIDQTVVGMEKAAAADGDPDEREQIEQALIANAGNQSRAAKALGMPRRTLVRKIARFGIPRPQR